MHRPQVGEVMKYRDRDAMAELVLAPVVGVSELEVIVDLDGKPYGFSWSTFDRLFEPSTAVSA